MFIKHEDPNTELRLALHVSSDGDLINDREEVITELDVETERVPVEVDVHYLAGQWSVQPPSDWRKDATTNLVNGSLAYTNGDAPVEHLLELTHATDPTKTKTKPLPIKIKPVIVGPDDL